MPDVKNEKSKNEKRKCLYCGKAYVDSNYYNSNSIFYSNGGKIPYCKQCIERFYQLFVKKYAEEGYSFPEKKAVKRLCMALDIYYKEDVYNSSLRNYKKNSDLKTSPMSQYMRVIQLLQYNRHKETYENTLKKEEQFEPSVSTVDNAPIDANIDVEVDEDTIIFFGGGFSSDDYAFLKREYDDWVARHECKTKAQEEIFKRICFKQLEILKATRRGEDTKHLDATFRDLLDTAKLQPKQNSGDTTADNQTFGTLIDKWENTRPIDEPDEQFKDVDNIGLYIDTFYRGHLAKMMGLKNGFSNLYSKFMKKFTVSKPEYNDDDSSEVLFDTIFGNASDMNE